MTTVATITGSNINTYPYYTWGTYNIPNQGTTGSAAVVKTLQGDDCADYLSIGNYGGTGTVLDTFQTVIRADSNAVSLRKHLYFTGKDAGLLVQAKDSVNVWDSTKIDFSGYQGKGDAVIQSFRSYVKLGNGTGNEAQVYNGYASGNLLISGRTNVDLYGPVITTHDANATGSSNIAAETGGTTFHGYNKHTQGAEGHYLVFGDKYVYNIGDDTIDMVSNATPDYAKIWSPAGWVTQGGAFIYDGKNGPLVVLAEGTTNQGGTLSGSAPANTYGNISFDGATKITYAASSPGLTQIQSVNDNVNFKDTVYYTNTDNMDESGLLMIQAGRDIYADQGTGTVSNSNSTFTIDHWGDRQIIMEAHRDIVIWDSLKVNHKTPNNGEFTMKAGYKANWDPCYGKGFTDTVYAQTAGNLTEYAGNVLCGSDSGNIIFNGNVLIDYSNNSAASDTVATVINAYRTIYVNNKFDYLTNSTIQAENHRIDHHVHPMTAGNLLMYAETGNVEAVEDEDSSVKDTVNITVNAASNNNGDIRIQAGPYLCVPNCNDLFDQNHGNILFNKPLNVTNNGSGFTILQAHRDIETQIDAPATFTHANVSGNTLSDTATLLVAGRHIETHATMKFDYDHTATDGSITLWAGKMDHPGGLGLSNWACTDALCKTIEEGSYLAPAGIAYRPGTDGTGSAFSQDGRGNGSILLFDTLVFNYYGDSTISLFAYNGNIENDPYLHKLNVGYDELNDEHNAPILFNHYGTGLTQMKAIDIKLHDKLYYEAMQKTAQLKNGQLSINAYDSILTRKIKYVNSTDTGSVFITTAKYKAGADCDVPYNCAEGGPGIHQGHIVLGYGADFGATNVHDSIIFDYNSGATNSTVLGGNIHILAGFEGFEENRITGKKNPKLFFDDIYGIDKGKGKAFGGNITFDYMEFYMPTGAGTAGGYTEIRTPNGNIWGKDSILYHGINGNFLVDAGLGSVDDSMAIRWGNVTCLGASEYLLNTNVPDNCGDTSLWRTGNIMMKGANLNFGNPTTNTVGTGNAVFRTREGFIDTYDAFTVDSMGGDLLKYAAMDNRTQGLRNNWGDVSERDFQYTPVKESGSVFFGADDNIMLNYGNSNLEYNNYGQTGMGYPGNYDVTKLQTSYASPLRDSINMYRDANPYYYTSYEGYIDGLATATFDVNVDGYMFYRNSFYDPKRKSHLLYRGCKQGSADCSGYTGDCVTTSNGARDIELNFYEDINGNKVQSGGFASVASNYIDIFTGFTYYGGEGSAMGAVPGMGSLHGESVAGYGLYMKSQFNGTGYNYPEKRRATCEGCGEFSSFPMEGESSRAIPEMTYIGFHDDARIHTHRQKSLLEAPVIEFFGHAEIDAETNKGTKTNITLKADSLIFHDSVIFAGHSVELKPFTTDATQRANDMRYGVINDKGRNRANYSFYGPAIEMEDRSLPVLELGYQRCNEPNSAPHSAPNIRSLAGKEQTPTVGGDVIVAFKYGYAMPMFNTVVANHARISFITDSLDNMSGGEFVDAFIRTDLLRIRNKVEFYTDPTAPNDRKGKFVMATPVQMDDKMVDPGMYTRHLHLERGSELSLPGEDSLTVIPTTVVGGYGNIHENVMVKANGILAPGFASLMEGDCQTPNTQGKLTVHNLQMEKDAVLRLSISNRNCIDSPDGPIYCTQTDTIVVQDTVYFTDGRVPVVILPETETLDPGCYLFMVYGDSTGVSQEYVKNFVLKEIRYGDYYFSLYFGERGKVYLCVTSYPIPEVQRWIDILEVPGVTTVPGFGRSHVFGHQNFTFTARYSGSPLKISAKGFYSGNIVDLDHTSRLLDDGSYQYTIYQVVEPWTVYIGPDPRSDVSNEGLPGQRIWTYKNTLYINVAMDDIVSIYNLTGVLYQKVEIPAGTNKFTLERGMYIVTLKDGSVHKIVIK
ncbi:MAG: T9SS type A sorting domain-containing protein [Tannerella sp.]|nr:T9SS type A sorting domain-containing protein [Tannerella sp.]